MDPISLSEFAGYINKDELEKPAKYFIGEPSNIRNFNLGYIKAWEKMKANKSTGFRQDYEGIRELRNIMYGDAATYNSIGDDAGMSLILQKNLALPCKTCAPSNAPYLQEMDKYLLDVSYFAAKYGTSGASVVAELKSTWKKVLGAAFQLRVMNAKKTLFEGATFDLSLNTVDDEGEDGLTSLEVALPEEEKSSQCRYDIKVGLGPTADYYEFKSWGLGTKNLFVNSTLALRAKFTKQLKTYFEIVNLTTIDQLHYIFDGRRLSEDDARSIIQKVFQDKADEWFDGTGSLFETKLKLLFGVTTKQEFKDKVNDLGNTSIYIFVKTL